jgi:LysR family transcriptional regulator, positive regulator for ilvC
MDYDALRLFVHLSRTLHFLRTSRECHVSPSALSRTIQRLERQVGRPLFERDRRTVRLTAAGARFAEHARDTLERWEVLGRELRGGGGAGELQGRIAIFASVTACQSFLPEVLAGFRARYPDIHIQLETGYAADALAMLAEGRVDVAVAALPQRIPRGLAARVLLHTPLVFAAPTAPCEVERLCRARPLPWGELPVVLPAAGLARESADRWFKRRRITPRVYGEVPGSEAMLALVSLGCAVGIVPRLVLDRSPLRANVRVLPVGPDAADLGEFRVGVCTPRRKLALPLVRAFWDSMERGPRAE